MTCQHITTCNQHVDGCLVVACTLCNLHWREWPLYISPEEYDRWLTLMSIEIPVWDDVTDDVD